MIGVTKTEAKLLRTDGNINYIELYVTKKDGIRICVKDELIRLKRAIHNPNVFGMYSRFTT